MARGGSSKFKINLSVNIKDDKAEQQLNNLIQKFEQKEINLKFNVKTLESQLNNIKKLLNDAFRLDNTQLKNLDKVKDLLKQISKLSTEAQKLIFGGGSGGGGGNSLANQFANAKKQAESMIMQLNKIKEVKGFVNKNELNNTITKVEKLKDDLEKLDLSKPGDVAKFIKLKEEITECTLKIKELNDESSKKKKAFNIESNIKKTEKDIEELKKKLNELGKSTSDVEIIENELKKLANLPLDEQSANLTRLRQQLAAIKREAGGASSASSKIKKSSSFFNDLYSSMSTFSLGNIIADGLMMGIYGIKDTIVELDSAFRDLQKVAPKSFTGTEQELKKLKDSAMEAGQEVARSSVDIINSTASALQAGFKDIDKAMEYAKNVNMYANVADLSESDADEYVKAIMSAYGGVSSSLDKIKVNAKGASDSYNMLTNYMDQANYVGNNFALTSADVGEALMRSASSMSSAGLTMEESIGLIISAQESVQDSAKVGNSLKSLTVNLKGVKTNAKTGNLELNKCAMALEKYAGISVVKQNGEIMSSFEVLTKLSEKWDTFNDSTKAGLSEAIAGKYQYNVFNAMMQNFDQAQRYVEEFNEGYTLGSAERENERYINSIEGKITKLVDRLKNIVTTIISTETFKGLVDGAIQVVESVNNIVESLERMGMTNGAIIGLVSTFKSMSSALGEGAEEGVEPFWQKIIDIKNQISELWNGTSNNNQPNNQPNNQQTSRFRRFASAVRNSTLVTNGLNLALSTMNGLLIGFASNLVLQGIQAYVDSLHEIENRVEHFKDQIVKTQESIANNKNTVKSLKNIQKRYDELAKSSKRNKEEEAEYLELRKQIADLSPELVVGYDENDNPILALNGSLDETIAKLKETIELEKAALKSQQNSLASVATKNAENIQKEMNKHLQGMMSTRDNLSRSGIPTALNQKDIFSKTNELSKVLETAQQDYDTHRSNLIESYNNYVEAIGQTRQGLVNTLLDNEDFNKLSDDTQGNLFTFINKLNTANISNSQRMVLGNNLHELGKALDEGKFKISDWEETWQDAYHNFQASDGIKKDIDEYKESIEGMAIALENASGIDSGVWQNLLIQPYEGLDYAQKKLADFGKMYGLTYAEILKNEGFAKTIREQFNDVTELLNTFTSTNTVDIDILARINKGEFLQNLPQQIKDVISAISNDNKAIKEEQTLMLNLTTAIANGEQITQDTYNTLSKLFSGEEFNITSDLKIGETATLNQEELKKLQEYFKEQNFEINILPSFNKQQLESISSFEEMLASLGLKEDLIANISLSVQKSDIDNLITNIESFDPKVKVSVLSNAYETMSELGLLNDTEINKKFIEIIIKNNGLDILTKDIKELPEDKQVNIVTNIISTGSLTADQVKTLISSLPENVSKKISVDTQGYSVVNGELSEVNKKVKEDNNKKITVDADITPAEKKLNEIDNRQPKDKSFNVYAIEVPMTSGGGSSAGSGGAFSESEFTNISDTPTEVSTFSADTTESSLPTESKPSLFQRVKTFASRSFGTIGLPKTLSTKININKSNVNKSLEYSIELLQELTNRIDRVNNQLDLLDAKSERAVGLSKITYLQQQNELYKEQMNLQKELYDSLSKEKKILQDSLKAYGFKINAQGNLTNYEETLLSMESYAEKLEKASKNASEAASKYSGKSEKKKKSLESSSNAAQKKLDNYNEKLDKAKKLSSEYLNIQFKEIPDAENEWYRLHHAIEENNDEIERLELEDKLYKAKNGVKDLTNQFEILGNKVDLIDTKLNNSLEVEKISLMEEKLKALNNQLALQDSILKSLTNQVAPYQEALSKYNIQFDNNGNITNLQDVLNANQNSKDLEKINDLIEEYNKLIINTIPNAEKEYSELNNAIKELNITKLENVQQIEARMTEVIRDQLEKRKDAIQKQYDKEIELLNKKRDAYNDTKDEENYYKSLEEKQKEIADLQAKINRYSFDDSYGGKSKVSSLMEELKNLQNEYDELVANRTDELINKTYDDEIDRLQNESDKTIQDIEDKWTESKIAEVVANSLSQGIFTDIDGEIHNLQDTLVFFAEDSGEALGVLGDKIKTELLLNLQEALSYIEQYGSIMDTLGLKELGNVSYSDQIGNKTLNIDGITINVTGTEGMNEITLANEISRQLENKLEQITNEGLL